MAAIDSSSISQPTPMDIDPSASRTISGALEDMDKVNSTQDPIWERLCVAEKLLKSPSQELQDEFFALSCTSLPSVEPIQKMKVAKILGEKKTRKYGGDEGIKKEVDKTIRQLAEVMILGWKALPESVKNFYGEISSAMKIPKQKHHSIFSRSHGDKEAQKDHEITLLTQHQEFFSEIFSALHAHNVLCAGAAAGIATPDPSTTKEGFLQEALEVAKRLPIEQPLIPSASLVGKGMTSIPREISYAGIENRPFTIECVNKASFGDLLKIVKEWKGDAHIEYKDLKSRSKYTSSGSRILKITRYLEQFPKKQRFETAYICRDSVLQKLQGIILTKMTRICKRDGEDFGDYLKIVTLATNPQYHDTPSRIEGGAAALISYLAHECFQRETAGLYVKAKTGAQPFYEEFGFEHFFLDEKIETNSDDDESASGSGREIGVIRAKTKNTAQTKKSSSSSSSSSESERKVKAKEEARELSHRMRIETYNIKNLFPEEKLQLPMEPTPVEKPE